MSKISNSENVLLIEQFLTENYQFRRNCLSKKIEVRACGESAFRQMTDEETNSIIRRARMELDEATNVKTHVVEYLHSNDIPQYDPIRDWLDGLPQWDGQNRVAELFGRIPGVSSEQIYWLSVWMRSAVAHWRGMDTLHGNECVPTFIGAQGCGKSTFCRRLLPVHLREYFLDHLNLSNKFDKEMALTNSLLVNLDELDQVKVSQQSNLKQTLSKVRVNARPIFGREQYDRERYASFVATTNNPHPLQDPTGSRRYICVRITDGRLIDNETPIDYEQLYAQLMDEVVKQGKRYWFTNEETHQIQQANAPFQHEMDLTSMLESLFRMPQEDERARPLLVRDIVQMVMEQYPSAGTDKRLKVNVGTCLRKQGYASKHTNEGNAYLVIPRSAA